MKHLILFFLIYPELFITFSSFNTSIYFFLIINEGQFLNELIISFFYTTLITFLNIRKSAKVIYIVIQREYFQNISNNKKEEDKKWRES
jgi:hypothetical protein